MKCLHFGAVLAACLTVFPAHAHGVATPHDGSEAARLAQAVEQGLRPSIAVVGAPVPKWSLRERMAHHKVPGVAVAVVRGGKVVYAAGFGVRQAGTSEAVDADTLFSVGSVSKMATAATALRLVAEDRLALDRDIDRDLKSWHLPAGADGKRPQVTLRMLLSHTSGLGVHGFEDYLPGETLPTLRQTLDGLAPAKNEPVRIEHPPGSQVDYSGGGFMVTQQAIEDVTGKPFAQVAREQVFAPLRMARSTFENPLSPRHGNIAKAHGRDGQPAALPRGWQTFPEQAASGLWTSANDLGAFVATLLDSYRGKDGLLPQPLALQMMSEVAPSDRGLGPELTGSGPTRRFVHNGSNESYKAGIEGYPESGDGFVILTNGANGGAIRGEIRNALSDALGHGVKPVIRTLDPASLAASYPDFAGRYVLDAGVPMDLRGVLADEFDVASLEIRAADGALQLVTPEEDEPEKLLPLTPVRFLAGQVGGEFRFQRHADGKVHAATVEMDGARAYYRKQADDSAR
jgi:CubicO group peptidase (beta-lactamase class C family)